MFLISRNHSIKIAICSLGILLLFVLLYCIVGDQYNILFSIFKRYSQMTQSVFLFLVYAAIFTLSFIIFSISFKNKFKLLFLVPFITAIISAVMYWRGQLQLIDPTVMQETQTVNILNRVSFFFAISLLEAVVIAFAGFSIKKHLHSKWSNPKNKTGAL